MREQVPAAELLAQVRREGVPACVCFDAPVNYRGAQRLQAKLVAEIAARPETPPMLLLLEHPLVTTLGRGADAALAAGAVGPVVRAERGGNSTVHGPGQLVGYPLIALQQQACSVGALVDRLEALMGAIAADAGIATFTDRRRRGLWTTYGKLGSIGIAVRRWVSWHGFALYVADQRPAFGPLSPCNLAGVRPDWLQRHAPMWRLADARRAAVSHWSKWYGERVAVYHLNAIGAIV